LSEHAALRKAIGGALSVDACYRFARKLREHKAALDSCIAAVLASLRDELPGFGEYVAIDGSGLPAYANGQRFVSRGGKLRERYSDPDASDEGRRLALAGGRCRRTPRQPRSTRSARSFASQIAGLS
jgi:hypothetical protein